MRERARRLMRAQAERAITFGVRQLAVAPEVLVSMLDALEAAEERCRELASLCEQRKGEE